MRWVRQTDLSNDEAVGYLADRLARLGVEEALAAAGAVRGDDVLIGPDDNAVVFDFDPTVGAGAEVLMTRRGEDARLDRSHRRTTAQRRAEHAGGAVSEDDGNVGTSTDDLDEDAIDDLEVEVEWVGETGGTSWDQDR